MNNSIEKNLSHVDYIEVRKLKNDETKRCYDLVYAKLDKKVCVTISDEDFKAFGLSFEELVVSDQFYFGKKSNTVFNLKNIDNCYIGDNNKIIFKDGVVKKVNKTDFDYMFNYIDEHFNLNEEGVLIFK